MSSFWVRICLTAGPVRTARPMPRNILSWRLRINIKDKAELKSHAMESLEEEILL